LPLSARRISSWPSFFPFLIGDFFRRQPWRWFVRLGSKFSSGLFADQSHLAGHSNAFFASADPASFAEVSRNQGFCRLTLQYAVSLENSSRGFSFAIGFNWQLGRGGDRWLSLHNAMVTA
jgi:hypothetical protein